MSQVTRYKLQDVRRGFSIVELVTALGVFTILTSIAVGGFVVAMRSQRQITGLLAANSNASLVVEQMAREIRTGYKFCLATEGTSCNSTGNPFEYANLVFMNANAERVTYALSGGNITRAVDLNPSQPITGSNVSVPYLVFRVTGNLLSPGDSYPPRITIFMGINAREASVAQNVAHFQTTVSARPPDQ